MNKVKRIYISGPITGVDDAKEVFANKANELKSKYPDAEIINPAEIILPDFCTQDDYIAFCMNLLKYADEVCMLSGWMESKGSRIEYDYAVSHGISIDETDDWSKVPIDTPILVRNFNDDLWKRRYFAGFKNGYVQAFLGGCTSWTTANITGWECAKLVEIDQFEEERNYRDDCRFRYA